MNTPAHLLLGAAICGRPYRSTLLLAALIGALLPDLSLYLLAGVSIGVLGIPPSRVFNELYFSDAWQTVFAIDNSFVIWGLLFAFAVFRRIDWLGALTGAALLHIALDFPLHHDDGRPHFWPLSGWVFESPISYWDRRHGAMWVAPIEALLSAGAAVAILKRRPGVILGAVITILLCLELWIVREWLFFFQDSP